MGVSNMIQILSEQFRDILRANTSSKKTEGWIVGLASVASQGAAV